MDVVPTPAPASSWLRWPPPGKDFWTRVLQWSFIIAILACLIFIYFLGMQLRHESSAQRFTKEGKYTEAAEKYVQAFDSAHFFGRDRYLHLVSWCYLQARDPVRAMDFAMRLAREFPDSTWKEENLALVSRVLEKFDPENFVSADALKANTPLGQARAQLRTSYRRMITAIRDNKGGVSIELEGEYVKYRKYYENYKLELVRAYKGIEKGDDPEKVDRK